MKTKVLRLNEVMNLKSSHPIQLAVIIFSSGTQLLTQTSSEVLFYLDQIFRIKDPYSFSCLQVSISLRTIFNTSTVLNL